MVQKKEGWRITAYDFKRSNKMEALYLQTLRAYLTVLERRKERGQKGKKGILIETAKTLEKEFGWECAPDSYTVRRYLDRAERLWHISTH